MNINSSEYWNKRFYTRDWERKSGRIQTKNFAKSQIRYFKIKRNFKGVILDFGCALGDAIPIYKKIYKNAKLIGLDISSEAIKQCKEVYGDYATFIEGNYKDVPEVDIIIASNVFEHLSNDKEIAAHLLNKCKQLYIIVPYKEELKDEKEHVNSYDENYFKCLGASYEYKIFSSKGWSEHGVRLIYNIYFKNVFRWLLGKKIVNRKLQIMYTFMNKK